MALECVRAGAAVVLTYRVSKDRAEAVAEDIRSLNGTAQILPLDLADEGSRREFETACFQQGPVDALVNNAGADLLTGELKDVTYETKLQTLLEVDVSGTMLLSRAFGRRFVDQGRGTILTIGWDQSDRGMEGDSGELFAAAKNAVTGFTRSLALSLAPQVRVNCIAPGWIKTAWGDGASDYWQQRVLQETPLKRWGLPEDIAHLARFLLSREASYLTGQVINANGGAER